MNKSAAVLAWCLCLIAVPAFASYADDRAEIENLSARYMVAVDAGDIETVMATWAEDGVLNWVRGTETRQSGHPQSDVRLRRRLRHPRPFRMAPPHGRARTIRSSIT